MSYNETKTVLRVELDYLRGKSVREVYPTYLKLLGEPTEVDKFGGGVDYFQYTGEFQEVRDRKNGRWGVDWVLHHHTDYRTLREMRKNGITLKMFQEMAYVMSYKFKVDKSQIKLFTTTWYNGSEEPINLGDD